MMRRLSYCLLMLCLLAACAKETDLPVWDGPVIQMDLFCDDGMQTKAEGDTYEQPGENPYHENDIACVDFFFYPGGATDEPATLHKRFTLSPRARTTAAFSIELTTNEVNNLIFPVYASGGGITECTVFAIVNGPQAALDALDDTSMDGLKTITVTSNFETDNLEYNRRQDLFMMSGLATITLAEGGRTEKVIAQGVVPVSRYACKLTVGIKAKNYTDEHNKVWEPCVEEMRLYLVDGVKIVDLGGEPRGAETAAETLSYQEHPMYFFEPRQEGGQTYFDQIFDKTGDYYNTFPMYMYPQKWENGISEGNRKEPYIKLVLPWICQTGETSSIKKEYYYKIMIPKDKRATEDALYDNSFVRNNWYHYNVDVSILGADTDDGEVKVNPIDFYVYYWQDKNMVIKYASIGNARYLSVEKDTLILNNLNEADLRYTSSHPVKLTLQSVTRPYYGTAGASTSGDPHIVEDSDGNKYYVYNVGENSTAFSWFSDTGTAIHFNHPLKNNFQQSGFDYSPYTMVFTLEHLDGKFPEYAKTVTLIQYPAIYITAEMNSDPTNDYYRNHPSITINVDNTKDSWKCFDHNGYVFVDGKRRMRNRLDMNEIVLDGLYDFLAKNMKQHGYTWNTGDSSQDERPTGNSVRPDLEWLQWRTVNFTGGNRNMYDIHVSVLDESLDFIIGDPRTLTPDNFGEGTTQGSQLGFGPDDESVIFDELDSSWWDGNTPTMVDHPFLKGLPLDRYLESIENGNQLGDDDKRPLTYYYPADASDRTKKMLAPSVRIASKFGGLEYYNGVTKRSAEYKCATYQEDGYPAGRWRLPTQAEILFISMLTTKGDFVKLFGANSFYWSANGANKAGTTIIETNRRYALARCVYDSWYWDQYDDRIPEGDWRDEYVFGDKPRQ